MEWTRQQTDALLQVRHWINDPGAPQVFRLFGYAGTGKSTLAHEINEEVGGRALSGAYTGKAASVMARKGLPGATTIHRMIYTPRDRDGQRVKELKEELRLLAQVTEPSPKLLARLDAVRRALYEAEALSKQPMFILKEESSVSRVPLVIIDEASMIDERMALDLLSFGTKVLVLGDPAQLPPIRGTGYFIDAEPDVLLTEIHRQARDNPIIALATSAREGRTLPLGDFGAARVVSRIGSQTALDADQILCGTNAKRRSINARHRQLGGHDGAPMPCAGEKVVCLRNNHDLGLLNGTLWDVAEDTEYEAGDEAVHLRVRPDTGGEVLGVPALATIFLDEDTKPVFSDYEQFTFGYCLTTHKAQGSQWDNVVLFDDWPRRDSHKQWLYTGITRAAERLTVVI